MTADTTDAEQGCRNPEIGSASVYAYAAEDLPDDQILTPSERHTFEVHLEGCRSCEEELIFLCGLLERLKDAFEPLALPVSSIGSPARPELIQEYHELPLQTELAASGDTAGEALFPLTFTYAGGQVVGQFRKRAGQLFFTLLHTQLDTKIFDCELQYQSAAVAGTQQRFLLDSDEEQHLGNFREFAAGSALSDILNALKQFELHVRRKI